jgi:hypothetical protein
MDKQHSGEEDFERIGKFELFRQETAAMFNQLAEQYGKQRILTYIEQVSEIAPLVVEGWLFGKRTISEVLQKKIHNLLKNFQPEDAVRIPRPVRPPLSIPEDKK